MQIIPCFSASSFTLNGSSVLSICMTYNLHSGPKYNYCNQGSTWRNYCIHEIACFSYYPIFLTTIVIECGNWTEQNEPMPIKSSTGKNTFISLLEIFYSSRFMEKIEPIYSEW
jgi:hypothetical protein